MKIFSITTIVVLSFLIFGCEEDIEKKDNLSIPSVEVEDLYCGIKIKDSYRNFENLKDTAVVNWFKNQTKRSKEFIETIPGYKDLKNRMSQLEKRKESSISNLRVTNQDEYFYLKKNKADKSYKVFFKQNINSNEVLLFDPATYKKELQKDYVVNYIKPSWDGEFLAISLTSGGSEISEMVFMETGTKQILSNTITNCWPSEFGLTWLPDNSGVIYLHLPTVDNTSNDFLLNTKSVLYKLNNDPKKLNIILSRETHPELNLNPEDFPVVYLSNQNDKYFYGFAGGSSGYSNTFYVDSNDLGKTDKIKWKTLFNGDSGISYGNFLDDDYYLYVSSKNASNFKIEKAKITDKGLVDKTIIVPEQPDEVITDFQATKDGIYYTTSKNGVEAKLYFLSKGSDKTNNIKLPIKSGRIRLDIKGLEYGDIWVNIRGWLNDSRRYYYDLKNDKFILQEIIEPIEYPEYKGFVVEEIEIASHDGVKVPVSLIYKEELLKNKNTPILFYGYGAYGSSIDPFFSTRYLSWVEEGGVFCVVHVRGGGEKGEEWHKAGYKSTKPNTWKDLISAVEYMIKEGYTSNKNTAVFSSSAGGILVGRAMTERPDLFAASMIRVGNLNPYRREFSPNGANNAKEYGSIKDSLTCKDLLYMDPYLHLKPNTKYPATFLTAGMNDARILPWIPGKFAARLMEYNTSTKPVLFDVDFDGGHGFGESDEKGIIEYASIFAFGLSQTGHPDYQPKK
ncbi:prolyl oligopeptidase [Aquimarina sp. BL5]|uniref:prolyl oligopeptidase family serine peptidase n=1 Tax=Aquimarina sp. BL5 TaxID=1714860 RepID=UPI000E4C5454|nr:prolyl oligopeptidase family serine peptidase [Aquimarina sp. BL5]AXT51315.1 prolyl oligopeptidase [Aquimarina sp. BL5]RKM93370.1 prolyl oligopeptidase [Aquimarina sp. BL5]